MGEGGLKREEHFESLERQAEAATLGMWVFLASEILLFGGLIATYATYRTRWHEAFVTGVRENTTYLGSLNTVILITSSFLVAMALDRLRKARARSAVWLVAGTVLLGLVFLVIKGTEYGIHFSEGIYPGGKGFHFVTAPMGEQAFYTLYFAATGLHAIHVTVGSCVLTWCGWHIHKRRLAPHVLEIGALYWHLVDIVWIFLWPLFYLMR